MPGFIETIVQSAKDIGFQVEGGQEALECLPWDDSPYRIRVHISPEGKYLGASGIVSASGLSGDKTDLHGITSAIWAICLQCTGSTTIGLVNAMHAVALFETDARLLSLSPFQENRKCDLSEAEELEWLDSVFKATMGAMLLITAIFDDPYPESYSENQPSWLSLVTDLTGDNLERCCVTCRMEQAIWEYFYSFDTEIGVYRLTPATMQKIRRIVKSSESTLKQTTSAIQRMMDDASDESKAEYALRRKLAGDIANSLDQSLEPPAEAPLTVATSSHLFTIAKSAIIETYWITPTHADE